MENEPRQMRSRILKRNCSMGCCEPNAIIKAKQKALVEKRKMSIIDNESNKIKQPTTQCLKIEETNASEQPPPPKRLRIANTKKKLSDCNIREIEAILGLLELSKEPIVFDNDVNTITMLPQSNITTNSIVKTETVTSDELDFTFKSEDFSEHLKEKLDLIRANNGGELVKINANMRRTIHGSNAPDPSDIQKMEQYRAERLKNNLSARKSREKRKVREITSKVRLAFVVAENMKRDLELLSASDALKIINMELETVAPTSNIAHDHDQSEILQ